MGGRLSFVMDAMIVLRCFSRISGVGEVRSFFLMSCPNQSQNSSSVMTVTSCTLSSMIGSAGECSSSVVPEMAAASKVFSSSESCERGRGRVEGAKKRRCLRKSSIRQRVFLSKSCSARISSKRTERKRSRCDGGVTPTLGSYERGFSRGRKMGDRIDSLLDFMT